LNPVCWIINAVCCFYPTIPVVLNGKWSKISYNVISHVSKWLLNIIRNYWNIIIEKQYYSAFSKTKKENCSCYSWEFSIGTEWIGPFSTGWRYSWEFSIGAKWPVYSVQFDVVHSVQLQYSSVKYKSLQIGMHHIIFQMHKYCIIILSSTGDKIWNKHTKSVFSKNSKSEKKIQTSCNTMLRSKKIELAETNFLCCTVNQMQLEIIYKSNILSVLGTFSTVLPYI